MNSKEVQELTGLTRKALEYDEENGLINPIRGKTTTEIIPRCISNC